MFLSLLWCAHCFLCSTFCVFVLFWLCNGSIYFLACCMQTRWKNTLKLPFLSQKLHDYRFVNTKAQKNFGCSAFILFSDFSWYKSLHFFVFLSLLQRAHCFLCLAFCVFVLFWLCNGSIYFLACCMQRRWKNTLKLWFLSQKLHEYRFVNIKA